jgi:amidase
VDASAPTALELAAALRRGEVSAVEVTEQALARAERLDARLGLFVTRTPQRALAQAAAADVALAAARRDGTPTPPLLGVPCPVKDLARVAGVPCSLGSRAFDGYVPEVDDGVVTLLREAGTVLLGTTTTPELGLPCYTEPDVAPPARTPWDLRRGAGGSSGGAACTVAAGVAPVAHGSDGGGSIRIPASACGVVGLKPTRGRVSPGPHGVDLGGLAVHGSLAGTVADAAALLDVLARPWPGDGALLPAPVGTFVEATRREPGRLRVGVLLEPVITADAVVHPACAEATLSTAALLADLGHEVVEVGTPFPAQRWESFAAIWASLAAAAPVPPDREHLLRPLTAWLRERGRATSAVEYLAASAAVQEVTRQVALAWAHVDLVLSPTLADLPAPVGALRDDDDPAGDFAAQTRFTPWTSVWNLTGRPAISLPLHWHDEDGVMLPVGVMLGARFGEEQLLLSLAASLERARPWRHHHAALAARLVDSAP